VNLPKLYPITDARLSGLSHAEQITRLCEGGATFIQLREKHLSPREFYDATEAALDVVRERSGVRLIVNDRADIALALGADGVHLGQDDLDPVPALGLDALRQARARIDPSIPLVAIGGITHTNARAALDAGANSLALVSALLDPPDSITRRTEEFIKNISSS
jgi:thiamine monophosphate synthase